MADRAVTEERLRIARELHDVVAHTMSVVAVHAGTGRMVADDDPAAARQALATIETTTRSALVEMRRMLGVLRGSDGEQPGTLAPAPGLGDLDALVADVVRSGVTVEVRVEGDRADVPAGVDLAAYRIVQEALTNVIKHAGRVRATVAVRYTDDAVTVEVDDEGRPGDDSAIGAGGDRARPGGHARARRHVSRRSRCRTRPDRRFPRRGAPPVRGVDVTVRVGVVDDQPLIRTGLRTMIDHAADLELVGEAADGEEAVELARRQRPDVVLMDIRMPVLDGIEATRRITADADLAGVRVVMLTTFDVDDYVHAAIRAGASGFLLKDAPPEDVLDAIRVVARGDALLAPSVTRRIIEELAARPDPIGPPRRNWTSSPIVSGRCWPWSDGACRTPRSAPGSTSARPPPRPTSAT